MRLGAMMAALVTVMAMNSPWEPETLPTDRPVLMPDLVAPADLGDPDALQLGLGGEGAAGPIPARVFVAAADPSEDDAAVLAAIEQAPGERPQPATDGVVVRGKAATLAAALPAAGPPAL